MTCAELSDTDTQYFAVIANGEFIKTNALPTTPEPSDWLDLVDQAAANILTWKFGVALALGFAACCAATCACRRCQRNRRHTVLQSKYRRQIIASRGVPNGRKLRPPANRPQPYAFPVRAPGDPSAVGSGRFQESWRRPGPSSDHSRRSMRSGHSARGALLTGAGAVVPAGIDSEATTPPTPPHETCPECGLRLPDVCKLVNHVETHHGGRAIRRKESATALEAGVGSKAGGGAKAGEAKAEARRTDSPRKASPPSREGRGSPNARAARASRSSSKTRSESPRHARHASAVHNATAVATAVGTVVVTAVPAGSQTRKKTTAPAAEPPSRSYPGPAAAAAAAAASSSSKPRANSPGTSGSGSGRSGSGRSGSSSAKTKSASPGSNESTATPARGRDALPRFKDISGHGSSRHGLARDKDSSGHGSGGGSGGDSLPRVLPRVKDRERSGGDSDELPRILPRVKDGSGHGTSKDRKNSGSAGAKPALPARGSGQRTADVGAAAGAAPLAASQLPGAKTESRRGSRQEAAVGGSRGTRTDRDASSPPLETRRSGDRGGGGVRGTSRERGRASADKGKPSRERGRSRGRSRQRAPRPPALEGSKGLVREDSTRSLARTASLDRVSALSSRALTRSNRAIGNDPAAADGDGDAAVGGGGGGAGDASGGARGTAAREREQALNRRGIRRVASTEDIVPADQRLTADRLRMLGSGLATEFTLSPPVFSPVKGSGKEPAYSPVARDRAAELDESQPVSLTRKFFRQLSGEL